MMTYFLWAIHVFNAANSLFCPSQFTMAASLAFQSLRSPWKRQLQNRPGHSCEHKNSQQMYPHNLPWPILPLTLPRAAQRLKRKRGCQGELCVAAIGAKKIELSMVLKTRVDGAVRQGALGIIHKELWVVLYFFCHHRMNLARFARAPYF